MPFHLVRTAGRQQHSVAIINVAAWNLPRKRTEAWVVLRPLHAILFEDSRVMEQKLPILHHLKPSGPAGERQTKHHQHDSNRANRPTEQTPQTFAALGPLWCIRSANL